MSEIEKNYSEPEATDEVVESVEAAEEDTPVEEGAVRSGKYDKLLDADTSRKRLTGMFKDWFLDYASYVILERAVPHIEDGLKPVQRRILHSMRKAEDGRYNKVAAIVGDTMHFHPHGDASIGDALVQLGQKDLLIDCQGNWGNIFTGDGAAAPRYIEARLTKFAMEVVFNPKTTEWMLSYDGRNNEPVTLPVKFPLLLAQGVEGIAVGLASKILPHNFNELIDAAIAHLKGEQFELYPDFPTGGLADVSRYNDGLRGGAVRVRAKITKSDKRTLIISEIPFGTTTESIKESIIKANEKGQIKIRHVDDNTAQNVELVIQVAGDESTDKTIDALYAFTDCEVSISPNACVICDEKPCFIGVSEILRRSAERTKWLLGRELEIRLEELAKEWHTCSLERIFIENKIYQVMEGCSSREEAYEAVDKTLEPFKKLLRREVVLDDVIHLTDLKFIRITRYDADKTDQQIKAIEAEEAEVKYNLDHLVTYTVNYYKSIKKRYGKGRERRTELRQFDNIEVAKVALANSKLYVDRAGGFFGIGAAMKKEEYVCDCSDLDDVILITRDGRYIIKKVLDKDFFAPDIIHIGVFKRNDERTIYNVLYRDGDKGAIFMKRCAITSITRDKEYNITKGTPKSKVLYMSVNPNGEAETLKVFFRQRARLKKSIAELDFSQLLIKGRSSQGNLFSRYPIHKIVLKEQGVSTLAGVDVWFDQDVLKLNTDGRGRLLGQFEGADKIIVYTAADCYYTTGYEVGHHFPEDTTWVEKYDPEQVLSVVYWDDSQKYYYLKRFTPELSDRPACYVDEENRKSRSVCLTKVAGCKVEVTYGGKNAGRPAEQFDVDSFVAVKSRKAKGKRLTTYEVASVKFIEPEVPPTPEEPEEAEVVEPVTAPAVEVAEPAAAEPKVVAEPKKTEPKAEPKKAEPKVAPAPAKEEVELIIERPSEEDSRNSENTQLNLFG
ncbi:MAG: DNA gyrase/topoisomerase IV subunit A [Tidjanibacter sp.]|nr:DNA gyrase/topoisomerase IV subunit A [Tidjanibacter sp.]